MNSLYAPGLKNKIVNLPSINSLITTSDGFVKKELSTYKLDIMGLCGFGCRYCSSNAGLGMKFRKKTFESALTQLESIVEELESGSLDLNKMMKLFEEGMQLTKLCRGQLKEVEERIITIIKDDDEFIEKPGIES